MKALFSEIETPYDGSQLRSLFGYLEHGVLGDSVVAWVGPCSISFEKMVDGEDLLAGESIQGSRMLHFIIEKFHQPLFGAIALQRLFAAIQLDLLRELAPASADQLRRSGDDLYLRRDIVNSAREGAGAREGEGKLSISIATLTPMSSVIHFALNISNLGTPVAAASLEELEILPQEYAQLAMARLLNEVASIEVAAVKVRWVK